MAVDDAAHELNRQERTLLQGFAAVPVATGLLMERHRIDAISARALLGRVAREQGTDESVLAAALVALLSPHMPGEQAVPEPQPRLEVPMGLSPSDDVSLPEEPTMNQGAGDGGAVPEDQGGDEDGITAAHLVAELTGTHPDGTVIFSLAGDDVLRVVGSAGTSGDGVGGCRTLPLGLDLPWCACVTQRKPIFLESAMELEREYPASRGIHETAGAWACVPVFDDGRVAGVVGMSWRSAVTFDAPTRDGIVRAVESAGRVLVRQLSAGAVELRMLTELMALVPDSWVVLSRGTEEGSGFMVEAVAPSLPVTWIGVALLDLFPGVAPSSEVLSDLQQVLRSGVPLSRRISTRRTGGPPWEELGTEVRIVRSAHRVVLAWR